VISRLVARSGAVEGEDLLLTAWNVVAIPIGGLFAESWSSTEPAPLLGAIEVAAVLLAIIALATRPTRDDEPPTEARVWLLSGPLIGALALVGGAGVERLGFPGVDVLLGVALLVGLGATAFSHRLPVVDPTRRRLLVLPLILISAGAFQDIASDLVRGLDAGAFIGAIASGAVSGQDAAIAGFVLGLVSLASALFFSMLIVAPRELADPEPRPSVWFARFGLFLVSALTGITVWTAI
jgi:hypothetical protein